MAKGLYKKFKIIDMETGEEDTSPSFTLKPVSDPAAREAILSYATYILESNPELYTDLVNWINAIEEKHGKYDWKAYWESLKSEDADDSKLISEEWTG